MACRTIPFCISMPNEVYSLERTHYVEINANIFLYLFHVYRKGCFHYIKKGCFLYKSQFPHKSISIFKFNITLLCWNGKGRNGTLHHITENWTINTEHKSTGLDNQDYRTPYLYHSLSNNQQLNSYLANT